MPELDELVTILKAAGETTRLRLLALLSEGELSVKDLTSILEQSQPRVSRHLKLLAEAGLVTRNAEGAWAYYRLADEGLGTGIAKWLSAPSGGKSTEIQKDHKRLQAVRKERQSEADAYFAKIADEWDVLRGLHISEAEVESALVGMIGPTIADLLVDLGTGTGRMLELLVPNYRRAVGIDTSREMLAIARARLQRAEVGKATVRLGDISELDPATGQPDVIVIHQVLHYFDDPGRAITEARKVLAPGGRILVVDFAPHQLEFLRDVHQHRRLGLSADQMRTWAHTAGLTIRTALKLPNKSEPKGLTVCLWELTPEARSTKQGTAK